VRTMTISNRVQSEQDLQQSRVATPAAETSRRNRRFNLHESPTWRQVIVVIALIVIWQLSRYVFDLRPLLPYPSGIADQAWLLITGPERDNFFAAVSATVRTILLGFLISVLIGTVLGFIVGYYRLARMSLYPYINALYATPRLALLPLVVVWFGIGQETALAIIVLASAFHVAIGTAEGVRNSKGALVPVGKSFGANWWQLITKIVVPASIPYLISSWKLAAGRAVVAAITAELFVDLGAGLGRLLSTYSAALELDKSFVVVIVIAILGFAFMSVFDLITILVRRAQGLGSTQR
jgi:ABC-type nitrate/sulfonate/bicarbonate transport system permease component